MLLLKVDLVHLVLGASVYYILSTCMSQRRESSIKLYIRKFLQLIVDRFGQSPLVDIHCLSDAK